MNEVLIAALSIVGTLILTSLYGLATTALRKRIVVRSPEAQAIDQITPAVNALIETNGPMMHGIIAILEAQKGQCNGNVDSALAENKAAKKKFDAFLVKQAKVSP